MPNKRSHFWVALFDSGYKDLSRRALELLVSVYAADPP